MGNVWRSIWVAVLGLTLLLMGCNAIQPQQSAASPSPSPASPVLPSPALLQPATNPPAVRGGELLRHVQSLSGERYAEADRARIRDYLSARLVAAGFQPQQQAFESGVNLVAHRPGTDSSAGTILLTAHYDTVPQSPGADDNATGVAVALEVVTRLRSRSTPRSLAVAFFDREERGLQGSLAFTANPANLADLQGVINLEMLGYACYQSGCQRYPENLPIQPPTDRGDFVGVVGDQEHLPLLQAFQLSADAPLPPVITLPIPFKGLLTPDVLRSDHAPFWARGIGAVMVGDTANFRNPHYHQPSDIPETLEPTFLEGAAQIVMNATTTLLDSTGSLSTPAQ